MFTYSMHFNTLFLYVHAYVRTMLFAAAGSQKYDDSEPMVPTAVESDSSKKSTTSSAMNPL